MAEPVVAVENITFAYPGAARPVFRNFSFQLGPHDHLGLIGPNGSGKTTLLHLIMGLLRPQAGRIIIFGQEVKSDKDFVWVRQQIGLLFQNADDQLFCPTVLEDVAFGPLNLGKTPEEAQEIALATLARWGRSDPPGAGRVCRAGNLQTLRRRKTLGLSGHSPGHGSEGLTLGRTHHGPG